MRVCRIIAVDSLQFSLKGLDGSSSFSTVLSRSAVSRDSYWDDPSAPNSDSIFSSRSTRMVASLMSVNEKYTADGRVTSATS